MIRIETPALSTLQRDGRKVLKSETVKVPLILIPLATGLKLGEKPGENEISW